MPDLPRLLARIRSVDPNILAGLALALALLALLAALVFALCRHGRRLERHREWLLILEDRISGPSDRQSRNVRFFTPRPPPLSQAPTVEIDEHMLLTQLDKTRLRPPKPKDTE